MTANSRMTVTAIHDVPHSRRFVRIVLDDGARECLIHRITLKSPAALTTAVRYWTNREIEVPPLEQFPKWLESVMQSERDSFGSGL